MQVIDNPMTTASEIEFPDYGILAADVGRAYDFLTLIRLRARGMGEDIDNAFESAEQGILALIDKLEGVD